MTRTWWPHENRTLGDLRSCLRWFRSRQGPIYAAWDTCTLTSEGDQDRVFTYPALLKILDGPQSGVDDLLLLDYGTTVDVFGLFRMYRRMRRAEQREADALFAAADGRGADGGPTT